MEWILVNHHARNCFASLGTQVGDNYIPSKNCVDVLEEIYQKLSTEDKLLRTFRKAINFSQALQNDFIPLLVNTKESAVIKAVVRILVSLLVPIECLLPMEVVSQTEAGRITVYELNAFLKNSKPAFRDPRATKAILEYMKTTVKMDGDFKKLTTEECESINNCLLLLRNILHIPDARHVHCSMQNQIVWNMFVQNLDKVLIHLMTCEHKGFWSVAMVQLIAVLYKDQHACILQKLINVWFEGSVSESSEDNESNTSPHQRSDSSPILTSSDPTSDSSDTGGGQRSGKTDSNQEGASGVPHVAQRSPSSGSTSNSGKPPAKMLAFEELPSERKGSVCLGRRSHGGDRSSVSGKRMATEATEQNGMFSDGNNSSGMSSSTSSKGSTSQHHRNTGGRSKGSPMQQDSAAGKRDVTSQEFSDCGYVSHETPEAVSTSSNEEESLPTKRPVHQKPHIQKTRYTTKQQSPQEKKEVRRKKLIKRSKTTIMNMKAIANHVPTDEDVSHILKEFTVDFLLKGYEPLLKVLHAELLSSRGSFHMDTSHFFWLMTYFLKFAGQLELDLDHVRDVLSYGVLSYLVYEGVLISEEVEVAMRNNGGELKSFLRRQHLVVTAIREFVLSMEAYDKVNYHSSEDRESLQALHTQISAANDLKCLFVMLLRQYKEGVHSKQYLEDLIVTNHIFLTFLERQNNVNKTPQFKGRLAITDLIKLFASTDVMKQYGLLLEDFQKNGEYINDCVFTMMHHIGGELNQVASLCQPNILKIFTQIWESDFELCDDWSDLIEYVIHRFVNIPRHCPIVGSSPVLPVVNTSTAEDAGWSKEECGNLYWYFALSSSGSDLIASIINLYEENGVTKTRIAVIDRLAKQGVINADQYKDLLNAETQHSAVSMKPTTPLESTAQLNWDDEVHSLREVLLMDDMSSQLSWLQKQLLEACYVKLILDENRAVEFDHVHRPAESVPYHYSLMNQSIPLVVWSSELATAFRKKSFQSLLRKLGFHLPGETGKLFFRIPSFWTADVLLTVAQKLGPIDSSQLKFDLKDVVGVKSEFTMMDTSEPVDPAHLQPFAVPRAKTCSSLIKYTPPPNLSTNWLDVVKGSKSAFNSTWRSSEESSGKDKEADDLENASVLSMCDTNVSDLTRMCVSDEEEVLPVTATEVP